MLVRAPSVIHILSCRPTHRSKFISLFFCPFFARPYLLYFFLLEQDPVLLAAIYLKPSTVSLLICFKRARLLLLGLV